MSQFKVQVYHRVGLIDISKLEEYNTRRKQAHETNNCAFCGKHLNDRRKIYCNSNHLDKFWEECDYWIATWANLRYEALTRDKNKCVKCGRDSYLEVDHIIEIADGGPEFELSNLQTLCHYCHVDKTTKSVNSRNKNRKINHVRAWHIPLDQYE